jgi:YQGE family putative transporter
MLSKLRTELAFFGKQPHNFRTLILTNMVYALVGPVIDIFVSAYIMRSSNDPTKVVIYQLTIYTGIPLTFLLNGFLLRHFSIRKLFSAGMLLSGVSMLAMMSLKTLSNAGIGAAGLIMGMSFGFYWANRDTLVLDVTDDGNRNYYYGLETFLYTIIAVIMPFAIGWFIHAQNSEAHVHKAYLEIVGIAFCITILASLICLRGRFENPPARRFVYLKFHPLWYRLLLLALLKGLGQGFLVTAPSMLIMTLLGDEGSLGHAQTIGALFAAIAMYVLGRLTSPDDRIRIFAAGLLLFLLAALSNAILFNAAGVILFMLFLLLAKPLLDLAYFPIQFRVIDIVKRIERRSEFSYILNHEAGLYVGRFGGALAFLLLAYGFSTTIALRYAILLIAAIQLLSLFVASNIVRAGNSLAPREISDEAAMLHTDDSLVTHPT